MSEFQVVVCRLGKECYGLDIGSVYEIIRFQEPTAVPTAPRFVDGVINLRGRIIPVVDLSSRFGMPRGVATKSTRIIVAGTSGTHIGLVVDAVTEVLILSDEKVEQMPSMASADDAAYVKGVAKLANELVILLDLAALFSEDGAIDRAA
jgi:purine-binding chemotaxis protein CheW